MRGRASLIFGIVNTRSKVEKTICYPASVMQREPKQGQAPMPRKYTAAQLTKSVLFKTLTYRAAGFLGKPLLLLQVARKALTKAEKDASLQGVAAGAFDSLKRLVRLVKAYATGTYRKVDRKNFILVVATIMYFISPLDIIPDAIPLIGLLDDITLMGWVIKVLGEELDRFESFENGEVEVHDIASMNYQDLYAEAKAQKIPGRSGMNRNELVEALKRQSAS